MKFSGTKCDRCSEVCDGDAVVMAITAPGDVASNDYDLCAACLRGLLSYLEGRGLSRPRAKKEAT